MDYNELALDLRNKMLLIHKLKAQKQIIEFLQGEAFVLDYISAHDGDVLPSQIGSKMGVSSARVATALNSLEKKGLITRRIDVNDRRKILVRITPEGHEQTKKHQEDVTKVVAEMLSLLGEDDAKEYVRIMGRLCEIIPKCSLKCSCTDTFKPKLSAQKGLFYES